MSKREKPLGDGLYLDTRCDSYLWRGRVNGKPKSKRIKHPQTGAVATTTNMTLTEARRIAKAIAGDVAGGGERFFPKPAEGITVRDAWKLYWDREAKILSSSKEKDSHWRRIIEPAIGDRIITTLDTDADLGALVERHLQAAYANGEKGNATLNLFKNLSAFFAWCEGRGRAATGVKVSPMRGLVKPIDPKRNKRPARALGEQELIWLFAALDRYSKAPCRSDGRAQRIRDCEATEVLLRSMCRRNEIFDRSWDDLSDEGLFIPKTKMGYPLLLPLTDSMRAIIGEKPEKGDRIFVAKSDWLAHTIEDIRPIMTEIAQEAGSNADFHTPDFDGEPNPSYFTLHDFRDTAKTWMGRQMREDEEPMFSRETQEACLNHREKGVGAIYNADLDDPRWALPQRKRAGALFNAYLDGLKAKALEQMALAA